MSDLPARERHFVEELGILFDEMGAPRMMGRVLGHLLICDPPEQSAGQLADALDASAGSISTTVRMLLAGGMVEKVPMRGARATYYRLRRVPWVDMMRRRTGELTIMRELAARGLDLLGAHTERAGRLREFHDFYAYLEARMPELLDGWAAERSAQEKTR